MSKRRKGKKPNLPQATLDRARQQAGLEPAADEAEAVAEEIEEVAEEVVEEVAPKASTTAKSSSSRGRRRKGSTAKLENRRKKGELTNDMVQEILANPTKTVTEEELHQDYQHVLVDLRNMGVLAAALMVLLMALAQFI